MNALEHQNLNLSVPQLLTVLLAPSPPPGLCLWTLWPFSRFLYRIGFPLLLITFSILFSVMLSMFAGNFSSTRYTITYSIIVRYCIVTYSPWTLRRSHANCRAKRILRSPTTSHVGATTDDDDIRRDNADCDSTLSTGRCIQPHSHSLPRPSVRPTVRPSTRSSTCARPPGRKQLASIETALGLSLLNTRVRFLHVPVYYSVVLLHDC